jgi:hypothetical protein
MDEFMVSKKALMYLSASLVSEDALEEVRSYVSPEAVSYLIDILTFKGIFIKNPMNEDQDLENSRLRLERLGNQLRIDPSRQFVTIGEPGQKLISCINNFQVNTLLISENLLTTLNQFSIDNIKKLNCTIIKLKKL